MKEYEESTTINEEKFWNVIQLFINKAHVINKRIWGTEIILKLNMKLKNNKPLDLSGYKKLENLEQIRNEETFLEYLCQEFFLEKCEDTLESCIETILLDLLPKSYPGVHAYNLVFLFKKDIKVTLLNVTPENMEQNLCPSFHYDLQLKNGKLVLMVYSGDSSFCVIKLAKLKCYCVMIIY